jgi:type IV pilus assembly protein PilC
MNYDEFAFFNQQLAAMLRDEIPLEGGMRRLCADMRRGSLRTELEKLQSALASGIPLTEALAARRLPDLYKRLVLAGARSNDLPGALTLLADYYQRRHNLWQRLTGLMVYPILVLFAAFGVSLIFYFLWNRVFASSWIRALSGLGEGRPLPAATQATLPLMMNLWIFPFTIGLLCALVLVVLALPKLRDAFRWRLPAFRDASLAQTAATLSLLIKGGIPFPESLSLVENLETNRKARAELATWSRRLASGVSRFSEMAAGGSAFPSLFVWLVSSTGEDLAGGFHQAGEIYQARAAQRSEILLYAALPLVVLTLGVLILTQGWLLVSGFLVFIDLLNALG